MGVRFLNKYLKQHGWKGIRSLRVSDLKGKTIVVDTSIYLYRFKAMEALLPNMLVFLELFKKYEITPIFIFDGTPKPNKKEVLQLRQQDKKLAWKIYSETPIISDAYAMQLRKRFTKVSKQDVLDIKELLTTHHMMYIDAPHEADELCVKMVNLGKAYACLSDDMDMFLYGCPLVLRDFNLQTEELFSYHLNSMLEQIHVTLDEFKQICVLSGTDYYVSSYNLFDCLNMFSMFKKSSEHDFYAWMNKKKNVDYPKIMAAYHAYAIDSPEFDYLLPFTQSQEEPASESDG
jgi:5'-3' exonuclease